MHIENIGVSMIKVSLAFSIRWNLRSHGPVNSIRHTPRKSIANEGTRISNHNTSQTKERQNKHKGFSNKTKTKRLWSAKVSMCSKMIGGTWTRESKQIKNIRYKITTKDTMDRESRSLQHERYANMADWTLQVTQYAKRITWKRIQQHML